jgi:hypothetical protein
MHGGLLMPCKAVQVIGGDPDKDVAVLQLQMPPDKMRELKPIQLGTSANLQVGQKVRPHDVCAWERGHHK